MKEKISAHLNIITNSRDRRRMASDHSDGKASAYSVGDWV